MLAENTLLKTAYHFLLLLVGFDNLTYRKDYDRSPILFGSQVILPNALLCSYELNTLDACWIAVDVWSNSSRCMQESVYLSRT